MTRWLVLMVAGIFLAVPALSQDADARKDKQDDGKRYTFKKDHDPDGIGKFYLGREIAHVMGHQAAGWLERRERDKEENTTLLLECLELKEGLKIGDVGAGSGYFTFRMGRMVGPKGKIYAVDIQQEMLDIMKKKKEKLQVDHVELIKGTETDPKLPAGALDMILLVDVYHEFSYPYEMAQKMVDSLKPGGKLIFVEYRMEDPEVPIKLVHKMSQEQVKKEMAPFALRHDKTITKLPWQHIIVFEKTAK